MNRYSRKKLKFRLGNMLILVFSLLFFVFSTCTKAQKRTLKEEKYQQQKEILKKRIQDSTIRAYKITIENLRDSVKISDSLLQAKGGESASHSIYVIDENKSRFDIAFDRLIKSLPIVFTLITLLIAYFVFLRTARYKNYDFLSEVYKQAITNPKLSMLYDEYRESGQSEISIDSTDPAKATPIQILTSEKISFKGSITITLVSDIVELESYGSILEGKELVTNIKLGDSLKSVILTAKSDYQSLYIKGKATIDQYTSVKMQSQVNKDAKSQIRAFGLYMLNNFESILLNFRWHMWSRAFYTWERYIVDLIIRSSEFKELVEYGLKGGHFSRPFTKALETYIQIAKELKESFPEKSATKVIWDEYNKKYNKALVKKFPLRMQAYYLFQWIAKYKSILIPLFLLLTGFIFFKLI